MKVENERNRREKIKREIEEKEYEKFLQREEIVIVKLKNQKRLDKIEREREEYYRNIYKTQNEHLQRTMAARAQEFADAKRRDAMIENAATEYEKNRELDEEERLNRVKYNKQNRFTLKT